MNQLFVGGAVSQLVVNDSLAELVGEVCVLLQVGEEQADILPRVFVLQHVVDPPLARSGRLVQTLGEPFVEEVPYKRVLDANRPLVEESASHLAQQEEAVFFVGPFHTQLPHQLKCFTIPLVVVRLPLQLPSTFLEKKRHKNVQSVTWANDKISKICITKYNKAHET